jgi:hypothetical protein
MHNACMKLGVRRWAGVLLLVAGTAAAQSGAGVSGDLYRVDASASDIRLFVYRAGPLARVGHNHVIAVAGLSGWVEIRSQPAAPSFALEIPVTELRVDDAVLRREAGAEFASEPSARDVEQTRSNMLGPRLLQAERYPSVAVRGQAVTGSTGELDLDLVFEIAGRVAELAVPAHLRRSEDTLEVSGTLVLSHAALGLTPFRALFGALQVADQVDVEYRIVARR